MDDQVANYTVNAGEGDPSSNGGTTVCFNRVVDPKDAAVIVLDGKPYTMQAGN